MTRISPTSQTWICLSLLVTTLGLPQGIAQSFTQTFGGIGGQDGVGAWRTDNGYLLAVRAHNSSDEGFMATLHTMNNAGGSTGSSVWPVSDNVFLQHVVPAADGSAFVVGSLLRATGEKHDAFYSKINPDGTIAWTEAPLLAGSQQLFGGAALADGGAVFCGLTDTAGWHQPFVLRCNGNGDIVWMYAEPTQTHAEAYAVAAGEELIFTGRLSTFSGHDDVLVFKTDESGGPIWSTSFGGSAMDMGRAITSGSDGSCIVAGWTNSFGPIDQSSQRRSYRTYVLNINTEGDTLWTRIHGDTTFDQRAYAMDRLPSGEVYIVGERNTTTGSNATLAKVATTGELLWERIFDLGREDRLSHVMVTPGGVLGTGWSFGEFGHQVLFIRRNADGN